MAVCCVHCRPASTLPGHDTARRGADATETGRKRAANDGTRWKSWTKGDSVLGDTASPVGKKAKQSYEASLVAANGKYQEYVSSARTSYRTVLEAAMDSAFEGTDLEEANRIDGVIQLLRAEAAREARSEHILGRVTFMDIEGVGDKIVYLIESGSSMGGNRLKVAKSQLKARLRLLQPSQKFAVIFYNEYRERMRLRRQDDQSMYFATDVNKELAGHEVDRVNSGGRSDPKPALLEAISLKPDVIYFVTDSDDRELSPAELAEIRRLSASLTIHVVKLGGGKPSSRESAWLERLASQSKGEYREINIDTVLKK